MTFYHDTAGNVSMLASAVPIPPVVAKAWLRSEGQTVNNPTNPLNILYYGSTGQIGKLGRFAEYISPTAGLFGAAALIRHLSYYAGVRRAIDRWQATPNRSTVVGVARAIEDSPWAAGHYGGGGSRDGSIARYVLAHVPTQLPPPHLPPTTGHATIFTLTAVWDAQRRSIVGHVHGGGTFVKIGNMVEIGGLHWYPITDGQFVGRYLHAGSPTYGVHFDG